MKSLWLLIIAIMSDAPAYAAEHVHTDKCGHDHGGELLGHHWACPEYLGEAHFQMGLMVIGMALIVACVLIPKVRRVRQCA